ncbi:hypothetical protein GJAV_G00134470 [Gymnothorax javanicus]|nr:hypothetical protein GJAV_G00134470 [Gymnothorax javanicus]
MDLRCSHILSLWLSLHLLTVSDCNAKTVHGFVGESVVLPCKYDIKYHSELHSCWGRGPVPTYGCANEIISSDGTKVTARASPRYQLYGRLQEGDVSLTISDAQESDTGEYGCRVHIKGWFNDQKENVILIIKQVPEPTEMAPPSPTNATERTSQMITINRNESHGYEGGNSTGSYKASKADGSEEVNAGVRSEGIQLPVLLPLLILLLVALIIAFLVPMRKRWKKASEMLGMSQQPGTGVLYQNSDSSLGLHSREMAVENIYQMDEGEDY